MAVYSPRYINSLLASCSLGNSAIRGKAFENLIAYIFEKMPGVEIAQRNVMNAFNTEEVDIAIWNNKKLNGLHFLPNIVLIECKNWSNPVSSLEVNWFATKLANRGRDFGILIAYNGITGNAVDLTAAHQIIATHLAAGRHIIVINVAELRLLRSTNDLVKIIKSKLCTLAVSGTVV